jgi:predicted nuclease of predicted toxin-antitoxin system
MTPRLKTDENLPEEVADYLRQQGLDCESVHSQGMTGAKDDTLIRHCADEGRALVTLDLDFSDIRAYPPQDYAGIVVLRPRRQSPAAISLILRGFVALLASEPLAGRLWICDTTGVRIRSEQE